MAQVPAEVRTRILRAFAGRGLIGRFEAKEMTGLPNVRVPRKGNQSAVLHC